MILFNSILPNRFIDRDMFICFWGGGIGHKATREQMGEGFWKPSHVHYDAEVDTDDASEKT